MAWHWAVLAARNIPWKTVIAHAPRVAAAARQLYEANQAPPREPQAPPSLDGLQRRVEALNAQNAEQSRLIGELAGALEEMAASVATLRARLWLTAAAAALALILAVLALFL